MAKVDKSALHDFVNGEYVTEQMLDQNFEVLRVAVNDTDARVDEVYTKAEVDLLINNAVGTATVLAGTVFPNPPQTDGAMFYRTDLQMLFVYDNGYSGPYGRWRDVNTPPPASAVQLGGVKIGSNISVQGDGTISVPQASGGTLGVVRVGSTLNQDVNGTINVKMGKNSGLDADKLWGLLGRFILGSAMIGGGPQIFSGADGDFSTTASSAGFGSVIRYYRNLNVNNGHTLLASNGFPQIVFVSERLTLNGTISAQGRGAAGANAPANNSGKGGNGGGILIVVANEIVGNGKITASGDAGGNGILTGGPASAVQATSGTDGIIFGRTVGKGMAVDTTGVEDVSGGSADFVVPAALEYFLAGAMSLSPLDLVNFNAGAAGGGSGSYDNSTGASVQNAISGGGGGGAYGNGGKGSAATGTAANADTYACGGGGGGGGIVIVISPNPLPAITIEAKGGNGGNGVGTNRGYGGGGGGGGIAYLIAPSHSATISVSGGTAGTMASGATSYDTLPANGQAGFSKFIPLV